MAGTHYARIWCYVPMAVGMWMGRRGGSDTMCSMVALRADGGWDAAGPTRRNSNSVLDCALRYRRRFGCAS